MMAILDAESASRIRRLRIGPSTAVQPCSVCDLAYFGA